MKMTPSYEKPAALTLCFECETILTDSAESGEDNLGGLTGGEPVRTPEDYFD